MGQININSIRNKFDPLMAAVAGNVDILLIIETKIDSTSYINHEGKSKYICYIFNYGYKYMYQKRRISW